MVRAFFTIVLILLMSSNLCLAQGSPGAVKIYSGFLYHQVKGSFWHSLFSGTAPQEEADKNSPCSIEFDSPVSFSHQAVSQVPEHVSYFIKCQDVPKSFGKFIIKIYTSDGDDDYSIDPASEGRQVGINDEHQIYDMYIIYMILGTGIDHLEIVSKSGNNNDKYILDKLEIQEKN